MSQHPDRARLDTLAQLAEREERGVRKRVKGLAAQADAWAEVKTLALATKYQQTFVKKLLAMQAALQAETSDHPVRAREKLLVLEAILDHLTGLAQQQEQKAED